MLVGTVGIEPTFFPESSLDSNQGVGILASKHSPSRN